MDALRMLALAALRDGDVGHVGTLAEQACTVASERVDRRVRGQRTQTTGPAGAFPPIQDESPDEGQARQPVGGRPSAARFLDLVPGWADDVPTGAEGDRALTIGVASLDVSRVVVERMPVVDDLQGAIVARAGREK